MTEAENLDCMTTYELEQYILRDDITVGQLTYAQQKYAAMTHRLAGNINRAIVHEAACDAIYNTLPGALRW